MDETLYDQATQLLVPIWRGIPASYKRRYRRTIWQQFEDTVKSSAYTSNLSRFVSSICSRLGVELRSDTVAQVTAVVQSGFDRPLLKVLRDESTTCTLLVRLENEERKAEWEARQRAEDFEDEQQARNETFFSEVLHGPDSL